MSLTPVPPEQTAASCPNCSAPIVAGQRYCLSCGQPLTPVRLAFLDVLHAEGQSAPAPSWATAGDPGDQYPGGRSRLERWLRRYAGVLGLAAVLLLAIVIGLLVGHWVTQGNSSSGTQVVEVKGLPAISAAPSTSTVTTATATTSAGTASSAEAAEEAKEAKEAEEEEKKPAKVSTKAVKVTPTTIKKLQSTTGQQHQEELNKLGTQPIEVGG